MLEYLYAALREPQGLCLSNVSDVERFRAALYKARRDAADPALDVLALVPSPTSPHDLWIVKKEPEDASSEER